jgi:hypothetical protein
MFVAGTPELDSVQLTGLETDRCDAGIALQRFTIVERSAASPAYRPIELPERLVRPPNIGNELAP